ncbi:MAG: hypothetical protein M5U34_43920 [Chloroflexi bacterium]|nr:hypothetical protein [Chloroflexota bacterium]
MWGLGYYARLEHFLPTNIRRQQSHIVYALGVKQRLETGLKSEELRRYIFLIKKLTPI